MDCPHCLFSGKLPQGVCPQCGYQTSHKNMPPTSLNMSFPNQHTVTLGTLIHALSSGDVLRGRRYRLLKQLNTSSQEQRADWLASDTQSAGRRVLLRQIAFPPSTPSEQKKFLQTITQGLMELAQHPGFLPVIDVFQEQGEYYIVQLYPEGESLASLLQQQGGTLPEREVAEYGLQVCTMLSLLAQSHPPLINGFITPETIIISPDKRQVSLLHFPLLPPQASPMGKISTDYLAPEHIRGEFSPSSDLFSLAATLHHAITGYDPHQHQAFFYPPARRLNPVVTAQMEATLTRALRLSTSQRFTNPAEMLQELSNLIASYPLPSTTSISDPIPFAMRKEQIRQRRHRESSPKFGIAVGLSTAMLLLFGILALYPLLIRNFSTTATTAAQQVRYQKAFTQELNLELQTYRTKGGPGLSDGRLVFDIYPGRTKTDIGSKQRAATALQQGNASSAIDLLTQATTADPADGEAQIYNEDLHISQSGAPYISIVLGLSIDNNPSDLVRARADLESAFLAQYEINMKGLLPHGLRLHLLIDNSGEDDRNVTTVAQFIANRVKAGNPDHIVAVVGWPTSNASINARDILAGISLPMISQTASSTELSGSSPYFFRVNPPDDLQGEILGSVAVQQLHAKTVLVLQDPTDPYSLSLASSFSNYLKANHTTVIYNPVNFTEQTTTVAQYEQTTIPYAITRQADLIFLAGSDIDGIRLAHAIGEFARANPTNTSLTNLKILSGNTLDSNLLLGQGDGPDAVIATNFPQDMQRLIFTAFAHPDEWTFLRVPQNQQPPLFTDWSNTYQSAPPPAENAPLPGSDAILTYDAIQVIIKATTFVPDSLTGQSVRDALASLGHGNVPAFQGASGSISFDNQGNPRDKALAVLDIENSNGQNMIVLHQVAGKFF